MEHWQFSPCRLAPNLLVPVLKRSTVFCNAAGKKLSDKTICEFLRLCTSLSSLGLGPNMQKWWFAPPMPLQLRANQTHLVVCGLSGKRRLASLYRFEMIWVSYCTGPAFCPFFRVPMGALLSKEKRQEKGWQRVIQYLLWYTVSYCTLFVSMSAGTHSVRTQNNIISYHIISYHIISYHIIIHLLYRRYVRLHVQKHLWSAYSTPTP